MSDDSLYTVHSTNCPNCHLFLLARHTYTSSKLLSYLVNHSRKGSNDERGRYKKKNSPCSITEEIDLALLLHDSLRLMKRADTGLAGRWR